MRYNISRFIPNFFSTTVIKERFPFFVIPLSLMIFLLGFFLWTFFKVGKGNAKDTIEYIENIVGASPNKSMINQNNSLQSHEKQYYLGLDYFANQNYQEARNVFKSLYLQRNLPSYMYLRVGTYYAYSLMILGEKTYNNRLIQDSRDIFLDLYTNHKNTNDPLYIRVVVGYAKTLRMLNTFQTSLESFLRQSSMKVDDNLKRQIFLELGYIYSVSGRFKDAQDIFLRAAIPITSIPLYGKLLTNHNAIPLTMSLLRNNLIPKYLQGRVLGNLQVQMLTEATNQYKVRNIASATNMLKNILVLFPTGLVKENANYLLAYYSQSSGNLKTALKHYKEVVSQPNAQLNNASLYQMALINLKENNLLQAQRYFYAIINSNPRDYYAQLSYSWLQKIDGGLVGSVEFSDNEYQSQYLPSLNSQLGRYVLPFQVQALEVQSDGLSSGEYAPRRDETQETYHQSEPVPQNQGSSQQPMINFSVQNTISDSNNQSNPQSRRNTSNTIYKPSPESENEELERLRLREKELLEESKKRAEEKSQEERQKLEEQKRKLEEDNKKQLEELRLLQAQQSRAEDDPGINNDLFEEEEERSTSVLDKDFDDLSSIVAKKF